MDGGGKRTLDARIRLLGATGVVAAMAAISAWLLLTSPSASAGSPGGAALLPDLIVEPPRDISLQGTPGKTVFLRFDHTTSNAGQGPLEIYPDLATESCGPQGARGRVAYQAVFQDSDGQGGPDGIFDRSEDTETAANPVGCMIFHEVHNHYHFEDFARYELYRMKSGKLKETSDKVSFCVYDLSAPYPTLPGSPPQAFYSFANCDRDDGTHGISVGYADTYGSGTPGQEFDVSERNPGRYCLVARTDPTDRLDEAVPGGEDNNVQSVQIKMNTKNASKFGQQVETLDEPCSPPAA